jgi:hypothetical protein
MSCQFSTHTRNVALVTLHCIPWYPLVYLLFSVTRQYKRYTFVYPGKYECYMYTIVHVLSSVSLYFNKHVKIQVRKATIESSGASVGVPAN